MSPEVAFLIQFALILVLARALGELMQRFNQPAVLGELLAGILLGPSFLGLLLPDLQRAIFGTPSTSGPSPWWGWCSSCC